MNKIKQKIIVILIASGIILFCIFIIITKLIYDIPTGNNIAGAIGILTWVPIFIGTFIYAQRIINKKPIVSKYIKFMSIMLILGIMVSSIGIIIKSIL